METRHPDLFMETKLEEIIASKNLRTTAQKQGRKRGKAINRKKIKVSG